MSGTLVPCVVVLSFPMIPGPAAFAEEYRWQIRAGSYFANPDLGGGSIPAIPEASIELSSDQKPGVAVTWFVREDVGIEFFISPPFEFDLDGVGSLRGVGAVGRLKSLTPLLLGQWYLKDMHSPVRPYLGAGIAYTIFSDERTTPVLDGLLGGKAGFAFSNELSWVGQVGVDVSLSERWFANAMLAYLPVDTTATLSIGGFNASQDVTISAWATALAVGYRF